MKDIYKRRKKYIAAFALLAVALVVFIFFNSAQSGEESGAASDGVVAVVKKALGFFGITPNEESLGVFVRKAAHFSEYFVLGAVVSLLAYTLSNRKKYIALSPVIAFIVAACDEFIVQNASEGRSPEWRDVGIDFCGAMLATAVVALLLIRLYKKGESE